MQFLAETTKTKQIHANSEPKLQLFNEAERNHNNSEPKTAVISKTEQKTEPNFKKPPCIPQQNVTNNNCIRVIAYCQPTFTKPPILQGS